MPGWVGSWGAVALVARAVAVEGCGGASILMALDSCGWACCCGCCCCAGFATSDFSIMISRSCGGLAATAAGWWAGPYRVAVVLFLVVVVAGVLLHGLVAAGVGILGLRGALLRGLRVGLGVGGPVEIVVVLLHGRVVVPEARRLALLEVPGDEAVAVLLELVLDEAGAGDDVPVLVAFDVVLGVLEDVQQLAALEAESRQAFLAAGAASG